MSLIVKTVRDIAWNPENLRAIVDGAKGKPVDGKKNRSRLLFRLKRNEFFSRSCLTLYPLVCLISAVL